MIVGCYTMDLYCEAPECVDSRCHYVSGEMKPPAQFTGQTAAECRRRARKCKWVIDVRNDLAWCPVHRLPSSRPAPVEEP